MIMEMMLYIKCSVVQSQIYVIINPTATVTVLAEIRNTTRLVYLTDHPVLINSNTVRGTRGALIAILYFRHIFTLEPIKVSKSK